MKIKLITFILILFNISVLTQDEPLKIVIDNTEYIHRVSNQVLHEFSPKGQEDISKSNDMISIVTFKSVNDKSTLEKLSKQLHKNYSKLRHTPLKYYSLPIDSKEPEQYVIVILLFSKEYAESVTVRLLLRNERAIALIHSHKIFGNDVEKDINNWQAKSGAVIEKEMLNISDIPSDETLTKLSEIFAQKIDQEKKTD